MSSIPTQNLFYLLLALLFLALFAQLRIELPLNEAGIPITGQSFAVLLVAAFGGRKWGTLAIFLYLLIGALGLPVFAKGAAGWEVFTKGSGGYLYGFLFASYVVGILSEWGWGKTMSSALSMMTIGTILIIAFGLAQLTVLYGWSKALEYGFYPFWPGAVVKIILGALVFRLYHHLNRK